MCWDLARFQAPKDAPRFPEGRPEASVDSSALREERPHTSWGEGESPGVGGADSAEAPLPVHAGIANT